MKQECIYCLKDKEVADFNKEHVVPQSFGTFGSNTFTLNKEVCKDCNSNIFSKMELILGRGTIEGGFRYNLGVKSYDEYKSIGKNNKTILKIAEGPFKDLWAEEIYSEEFNGFTPMPIPQVVFKKSESEEIESFPLDRIPDVEEAKKMGFEFEKPGSMSFFPHDKIDEIIEALNNKGYKIQLQGEGKLPKEDRIYVKVEKIEKIDSTKLRVMAKIAFNYLTYNSGKDFVMQECFNPIREFILKGIKQDYHQVYPDNIPILSDERAGTKRRQGHLITVDLDLEKRIVIAQVSLFNFGRYNVLLSKDYDGVCKKIKKGHFFDPFNKRIIELYAVKSNTV